MRDGVDIAEKRHPIKRFMDEPNLQGRFAKRFHVLAGSPPNY